MFGIVHVVKQLDGEEPWQTKFSCLDKYLSVLLGAACEQGATLTAWWVWKAGGCCLFQREKDGKTPLHMALDRKHFQTAVTLVQFMKKSGYFFSTFTNIFRIFCLWFLSLILYSRINSFQLLIKFQNPVLCIMYVIKISY